MKPECEVCREPVEYDLIVSDELWEKISPRPVEGYKGGGLLCPTCIVDRAILIRAKLGEVQKGER